MSEAAPGMFVEQQGAAAPPAPAHAGSAEEPGPVARPPGASEAGSGLADAALRLDAASKRLAKQDQLVVGAKELTLLKRETAKTAMSKRDLGDGDDRPHRGRKLRLVDAVCWPHAGSRRSFILIILHSV